MQTLEGLVALYGPIAVFVGTFLEGETIVVVAGFLAHQNIINPIAVAASAFFGSFLGDQLWFYLGRRHAAHPFVASITRRPIFAKAMSAIENHPKKFILTFRFIYGIRTVSPVAVGLTEIPARDFMVLNALAAAIWAVSFTALGYVFGQAVETALGDIKAIEHKIILAAGCALAVLAAYHIGLKLRRRYTQNRAPMKDTTKDDTA